MGDYDLNRRNVLAGMAAVGGSGALVGGTTGALFSDEATFGNDTISASTSVSGVVDIQVETETESDPPSVSYGVTLPDGGNNNNPSYVWVRTSECPSSIGLANALSVELRVECNDGSSTIGSGTLTEVLTSTALTEGTLLCEDGGCFQPGEQQTLVLEVTGVADQYQGSDSVEFELEFYGQQCRYTAATENPFAPASAIGECEPTTALSQSHAISFIAFCSRDGSDFDARIEEVLATDAYGNPTSVRWNTGSGNHADYVVVKAGQQFTIYDYTNVRYDNGVATVGDSGAEFNGTAPNSRSSEPCRLATDKVGDEEFPASGTHTKLEYDGTFQTEGDDD
jgi:hypothetical protein